MSVRQAFGKKIIKHKLFQLGINVGALVELPEALRDKVTPVDMTSGWLNVGERVYVMGFPQLGEEICITDGVVARREVISTLIVVGTVCNMGFQRRLILVIAVDGI